MKDELQTKLVEIITSIQIGIGKAGDFAVEQLPDIVQQYILFGIVSNVSSSLSLLAIAIFFGIAAYKAFKPNDTERQNLSMVFVICSLIATLFFVAGLEETILVLFAPKVWLIMEMAQMIK